MSGTVKLVLANQTNKQALLEWEDFYAGVRNSTFVDANETAAEKKKRITRLEKDHESWFKYYFPNFYYAEPAPFHKRASNRVMNNPEWYEVRPWSRELSKSGRSMMEDLYLLMTGKKKNKLLISNSYDNACRLLMPYKINLEVNNRIINDYGVQEKSGSWQDGELTTRKAFSIRALGAGQSPRGTRKDEVRPDIIEFDDFDTDEDCRNPEMIEKKWKWANEAAIGTRSISVPTLIRWNGNIIAEDCCVARAMEYADHCEIINIRDGDGNSTWPQKNTEEMINRVLKNIPYSAQQKEYYNNPVREGSVFKNLADKAMQPLRNYPFLVCYTDPSFKSGKKNDYKATALAGPWNGELHVVKMYCQQTTVANMVDFHYAADRYVNGATPIYHFIEKNVNEDEVKRELFLAGKRHGKVLSVNFDDRAKGEKFTRIDATLEPLDRNGQLFFNEAEADDPDMKIAKGQFKAFSPGSRAHDDAPDAVEGATHIVNNKADILIAGAVQVIRRQPNNKRF